MSRALAHDHHAPGSDRRDQAQDDRGGNPAADQPFSPGEANSSRRRRLLGFRSGEVGCTPGASTNPSPPARRSEVGASTPFPRVGHIGVEANDGLFRHSFASRTRSRRARPILGPGSRTGYLHWLQRTCRPANGSRPPSRGPHSPEEHEKDTFIRHRPRSDIRQAWLISRMIPPSTARSQANLTPAILAGTPGCQPFYTGPRGPPGLVDFESHAGDRPTPTWLAAIAGPIRGGSRAGVSRLSARRLPRSCEVRDHSEAHLEGLRPCDAHYWDWGSRACMPASRGLRPRAEPGQGPGPRRDDRL